MDGLTMITLCKVCNTYVKYQVDNVYVDKNKAYIDCPTCMNQIEIKENYEQYEKI